VEQALPRQIVQAARVFVGPSVYNSNHTRTLAESWRQHRVASTFKQLCNLDPALPARLKAIPSLDEIWELNMYGSVEVPMSE
jgi:hypothetical protein